MIRRRLRERRKQVRSDREGSLNEDEWIIGDEVDDSSTNNDNDDESSSMKVWSQADKEIYEEQLEHLHDQLSKALIENQELKVELEESVKARTTPPSSSPTKTKSAKCKKSSAAAAAAELGHYRGSNLTVSTTRDGFESISSNPSIQRDPCRVRLVDRFKNWFFNILYDFTEEAYSEDNVQESPPLQAKKLKENLQRLAASSRPYKEFLEFMIGVIQWKSPSLSLVVFLAYMYCVWNGWVIQFILVIIIGYLSVNYLRVIGIVEQFGFKSRKQETEDPLEEFGSLGLVDKFQLVKEVGKMAQNTSEAVADNLEKGQNLLLWYYPQATRKLFTMLCTAFLVSLILPNSWSLSIAGLFIGFKVFVIDNVYRKYPKVKEKYDGVSKMWRTLPTNSQLEQRQRMTEEDLAVSNITTRSSNHDTVISTADTLFTERFHLSHTELPLEGWQSGKRCTLLDKERPLSNSKSGRLFLTESYLCFERSPRPNDVADRVAIPLKEVISVAKAKPFAVLPGSGMSIEIILKSNPKPVIFGAILHRDQAFVSLCDQAMTLGLDWGTDPDSPEGGTVTTVTPGGGTDQPLELSTTEQRSRDEGVPLYTGSSHT